MPALNSRSGQRPATEGSWTCVDEEKITDLTNVAGTALTPAKYAAATHAWISAITATVYMTLLAASTPAAANGHPINVGDPPKLIPTQLDGVKLYSATGAVYVSYLIPKWGKIAD